MSGEARCVCCELPLYSCGESAQRKEEADARAQRRRLLEYPRTIPARFPGLCAMCGEQFERGTPITPSGGSDGWRSLLCCPPEQLA